MLNKGNFIVIGVVVVILAGVGIFVMGKNNDSTVSANSTKNQSEVVKVIDEATALKNQGEYAKAKEVLNKVSADSSNVENLEAVEKELYDVNIKSVLSNAQTEKTVMHEVAVGDTLGKIAKKYGTTVDLIKKSNNLSRDIIRVGQKLRVWNEKFSVFVDKSQNKLTLKSGEDVIKVYTVSTGANNSSPVGEFKITTKLENPVWFNKGIVVPPESPENVLGTRWLGFDLAGYGIHGTIEPDKMGQQVTAGCVRMRNEEVEELYTILPMGTTVTITD